MSIHFVICDVSYLWGWGGLIAWGVGGKTPCSVTLRATPAGHRPVFLPVADQGPFFPETTNPPQEWRLSPQGTVLLPRSRPPTIRGPSVIPRTTRARQAGAIQTSPGVGSNAKSTSKMIKTHSPTDKGKSCQHTQLWSSWLPTRSQGSSSTHISTNCNNYFLESTVLSPSLNIHHNQHLRPSLVAHQKRGRSRPIFSQGHSSLCLPGERPQTSGYC